MNNPKYHKSREVFWTEIFELRFSWTDIMEVRRISHIFDVRLESKFNSKLQNPFVCKGPLILLCQIISVECPTNFEFTLVSCHHNLAWSLNFDTKLKICRAFYRNYSANQNKSIFMRNILLTHRICTKICKLGFTPKNLNERYFRQKSKSLHPGVNSWNSFLECSKGFFKRLKIIFLKKCQDFVVYLYFMSKVVLQ